ncbi:hypothetical protein DPMN_102951 [Dreissena polymorpha]|uniref:Uncharacterized protein n=1 Tax=Dreissena polymorpha TaxID=45954 RepID=A0A9D4H956_DREPO|nr:hypothetical protein DPMN_102951 [Dreissena polymorpha]
MHGGIEPIRRRIYEDDGEDVAENEDEEEIAEDNTTIVKLSLLNVTVDCKNLEFLKYRLKMLRSLVSLFRSPYTCTVLQRIASPAVTQAKTSQNLILKNLYTTDPSLPESSKSQQQSAKNTSSDDQDQKSAAAVENTASDIDTTLELTKELINYQADLTSKQPVVKKEFVFPDEERRPGNYFPTARIHDLHVDGVPFHQLPTVHIIATPQNTKGGAYVNNKALSIQSGGRVGFKNSKKKTAVCGQTVGFAMGLDLTKKGYKNARVLVRGFGQGRLAAIKGLQLAGINIVDPWDLGFQADRIFSM